VTEPLRTIVVLGGGIVALSAALGFARALPRSKVTLIGMPPPPGALADRLPAMLPTGRAMFDLLGISEADLLRAGATHRLANRFAQWTPNGAAWLHGFGETGMSLGTGAFYQNWLDARRGGATSLYHQFAPAAALAEAGRFVEPAEDPRSLLSRFDYALRIDPIATARLLTARAQRSGVIVTAGTVAAMTRTPAGDVDAVRLADGRTLSADLYVDCSGPGTDSDWVDWSDALPVDRLLLAAGPPTPAPLDDYEANEIGWHALWPLRDRTLWGLGYNAAITPEPRARRIMGPAGEVAEAIPLRSGRLRAPWRGNLLALGDAAVACGPLGWAGLAVAHADLAQAIELLPGRDLHPLLIAEYNRRATMRADRVRDFLSLHYLAAPRTAGPFWRRLREATPPANVALALAVFMRHGQLPRHDEETFDKQDWLAVLLGLGLVPAHRDPMTPNADPARIDAAMTQLHAAVAALPASLPSYATFLATAAAA
jgi:tryptophan halogenase